MTSITCRNCTSNDLVIDSHAGDLICRQCATVVGDRIVDVGSEWRTFSDTNADPSRVGAAENPLLENDLSTTIAATANSEYHNRSTRSAASSALLGALNEINQMADRAQLTRNIVERAVNIFRKIHEQGRLRNKPRLAIVSACLYIACKYDDAPRTFKEIAALSGAEVKVIARCYKHILKNTNSDNIETRGTMHADSTEFMSRFCSNLSIPSDIQRLAAQIAAKARDLGITDGRNPTSIAAAAIFMASQLSDVKKSQKEISEVAGCAESTIRQSYRLMLAKATDLVPANSPFHSRIDQLPSL